MSLQEYSTFDSIIGALFQVIAREDKGPEHGIDYKYSTIVTSYVSDISTQRSASAAVSSPRPRVFCTCF